MSRLYRATITDFVRQNSLGLSMCHIIPHDEESAVLL